MACPHLGGRLAPYEEIWHDLPAPPLGSISWILQSADDGGKSLLGKFGRYYLVLSGKEGRDLSALREEWDAEKSRWDAKYRIGSLNDLHSMSRDGWEDFKGERGWKAGETAVVGMRKLCVKAICLSARIQINAEIIWPIILGMVPPFITLTL
ncbi:uncharacterized protein BDW43DRAFT_39826 [Aspergillus alliaceus]|uniref:uncharacterized protein n=1 Tax=Petromyces alliaceus TaxID=209559 RepID=UPI0012A42811|nr:uncharacterized protein BDW43DRAFT_39826 [Aspergillus alliaceus]KAB8235123.1 hypothetical protein BDW43DRAFT_39826 [Aspergillus alliaceus]